MQSKKHQLSRAQEESTCLSYHNMPKLKEMESSDNHLLKTLYPLFIKCYLSEDFSLKFFLPLLNIKLCSVCPKVPHSANRPFVSPG